MAIFRHCQKWQNSLTHLDVIEAEKPLEAYLFDCNVCRASFLVFRELSATAKAQPLRKATEAEAQQIYDALKKKRQAEGIDGCIWVWGSNTQHPYNKRKVWVK
jgi:hypothetical protein